MTGVKFCGFVRAADVKEAVQLNVQAIGLVFYPNSARYVTAEQAKQLRQLIPSHIEAVGLFVNEEPQAVAQLARELRLDRLQLHGDETPDQCLHSAQLSGLPWWRGVRCSSTADLVHSFNAYVKADGFLIDSFSPAYGGTGKTFDWQLLQAAQVNFQPQQRQAIIMSGGLTAQNVQAAINAISPLAVDVSSGIQGANPREKDPELMSAFMQAVKIADAVAEKQV